MIDKNITPQNLPLEELIVRFKPLIKHIALKYVNDCNNVLELDDLISVGNMGLVDAAKKFDGSKRNFFKSYAEFRIRGSILDELRKIDWVSRSYREDLKNMDKIYTKIFNKNLRGPTDKELCAKMKVSPKKFKKLQMVKESRIDNKENYYLESKLGHCLTPDGHADNKELQHLVAQAISHLPDSEQQILRLRYGEDLTLTEIGKEMNLTESRISQLHAKAMRSLEVLLEHLEFHIAV